MDKVVGAVYLDVTDDDVPLYILDGLNKGCGGPA